MKALVAAAACFTFLACASNNAKIIPPELTFVQLSGPAEQNYPQGQFEVQYGLRIANRSSEPITLRRVQLQTISLGGPYRLVARAYSFQREVKPEEFADVTFWAKAESTGDSFSNDANAPVNVRATAYFTSPAGNFRRVFTAVLDQRGTLGGPR